MLKKSFLLATCAALFSLMIVSCKHSPTAKAEQALTSESDSTIYLPAISQSKPLMESYTFTNNGLWTVYIPSNWTDKYLEEQPMITSIVVDTDGTLWFATTGGAISTGDGVFRFDGQQWTHFHPENGFPFAEVSSISLAADGSIWFGSYCCGIAKFDGRTWMEYTTEAGLSSDDIRALAATPDGNLWVGTSETGAARFDGTIWETQTKLLDPYVGHIEVLSDHSVLFSTSDNFARLVKFEGANWQEFETPWTADGKYTTDISTTPDGTLWFTTEYLGVYQLTGDTWTHYTSEDGLPSNKTHCTEAISDGSIWFGSDEGIGHFNGESWETFSVKDGLPSNWISALAIAPDNSLWFGAYGGIIHYQPDHP